MSLAQHLQDGKPPGRRKYHAKIFKIKDATSPAKPACYNTGMKIIQYARILLLIAVINAGCMAAPPAATSTTIPTPPGTLAPYAPTQQAGPSATPTPPNMPEVVPSPASTPLTHIVKANEDMYGIAFRYRVDVEALIAANPTVNPRAMSVGTVLIIPPSAQAAPTVENPTPTALPVAIQQPDCWPAGDGGLWCFLLVENPLEGPVENVFIRFRLAGPDNTQLHERDTAGLLNLLPPGGRMPVSIYFPAPLPDTPRVSAELIAAFPIPSEDTRYLNANLSSVQVNISADGRSAEIKGQISPSAGSAQTVWVAAAALDERGRVVGLRRWENAQPLADGVAQEFNLTVYSLGGKIARLEYLSEIRR